MTAIFVLLAIWLGSPVVIAAWLVLSYRAALRTDGRRVVREAERILEGQR